MAGPNAAKWQAAFDEEMAAHKKNATWELTDLPPGRKAIGCKWVMRVKSDERYKSRLCAQGFSQRAGIDYKETFAPVTRTESLRAICAIAAVLDLELEQVDVDTAFLHGDLEEEIYMRQPPGYVSSEYPDKVCHLLRSLYGLKQAQHVYNQKWNKSLDSAGYKQGGADPCVRTLTRQGLRAISQTSKKSVPAAVMGTYVDDSLIAGTTESVKAVKNDIKMAFPIKDLGPAQTIVGIEIRRDRKSKLIHLSQKKHVEELLARCNMQECNPVSTPLAPGTQLNMAMCPASDEEKEEMMKAPYANVVGS
jgi:Reverse transcriptase (RNA-dependent DNA polymerase)